MTRVLVAIPTVPGRQPYLCNAARAYERHTSHEFNLSIVTDAQSAGEGWQRCVEQGLAWWPSTTHVHLSNDDICVAAGWLDPLLDVCSSGRIPAVRVEPAGGHTAEEITPTHPPMPHGYERGVPRDAQAYFFAGAEQPTTTGELVDHANLPFLTVEQWGAVSPLPPIHYGTDRWVSEIARRHGIETVACVESVVFNYNSPIGRHKGDWLEQDFAAFDGVFAMPAYLTGAIPVDRPAPERGTARGLQLVRAWRAWHEQGTPLVDARLATPEGRVEVLTR